MTSAAVMDGARVQVRAVGALILREVHTRFGRENIGYLWLFLEPGLLATGVAAMHAFGGYRLPFGLPVVPFYITGYTGYILFRSIVSRSASAIEANAALLYHRPVTLVDILVARAVLDTAATMFASVLLLLAAAFLGFGAPPGRPLLFVAAWGLNMWFCWAVGMLAAAGSIRYSSVERLIHPLTYLMLPFSGAFLIMDQAPPVLRQVIEWVPAAHILEMMREGQFETFDSRYTDPGYVIAWCMVLTLLGLLALKIVRRRVELP